MFTRHHEALKVDELLRLSPHGPEPPVYYPVSQKGGKNAYSEACSISSGCLHAFGKCFELFRVCDY